MTKFCTLFSSSAGNATLISNTDTNILIDIGVSASKVCASLNELGILPESIDAVFITHEHSDHISGLKAFMKRYSPKIYASSGTIDAIKAQDIYFEDLEFISIKPSEVVVVNSMDVKGFTTPHDSKASFGYVIKSEDKFYGVATDTGTITKEMLVNLSNCEAVLIESNHDEFMLKNGPYPYFLKKRILSDKGHLPNSKCAWLSTQLALWGTKRIALGHLSDKNNTIDKAYSASKELLEDNGFKVGTDIILKVSSKNEITII